MSQTHYQLTKISLAAAALTAVLLTACSSDLAKNEKNQQTSVTPPNSEPVKRLAVEEAESSRHLPELAQADSVFISGMAKSHSSQPPLFVPGPVSHPYPPENNRENYQQNDANPIKRVSQEPLSTFSIDVDTGSYANVRRFLQSGSLPPEDAVRVEELLNYFSYNYPLPENRDQPFSTTLELGATPWNPQTHLLHVGIKGFNELDVSDKPVNLVFLVDVSGSMNQPDKLGLLKSSLKMLTKELKKDDTVSLVTYAGSTRVVLEPTPASERRKILAALKDLTAGGSTNGEAGIELAYQQAEEGFKKDGVNRVILATDGDFNVGISDIDTLKKRIAEKRESGIALTTLGFGTGNYNDYLMEQLADTGNGNYAYIDTLGEARKVLVDELTATLITIASDVKIQIEFNPAIVAEYRLIGYRNRLLKHEDFNNDRIDAGEIGAGHTVTALYEIALKGEGGQRLDPLRYQPESTPAKDASELAYVKLRYKLPGEKSSRLLTQAVDVESLHINGKSSDNYRFSAAVAAFGQTLSGSDYLVDFSLEEIRQLAAGARGEDPFGYRSEFLKLVALAEALQP